jgi:hypothetical protein
LEKKEKKKKKKKGKKREGEHGRRMGIKHVHPRCADSIQIHTLMGGLQLHNK